MPSRNNRQRTIQVAELFAGVGGFRLGLEGYQSDLHPEFNLDPAGPYETVSKPLSRI